MYKSNPPAPLGRVDENHSVKPSADRNGVIACEPALIASDSRTPRGNASVTAERRLHQSSERSRPS